MRQGVFAIPKAPILHCHCCSPPQVKPDLVLMGKQAIDGDNCQTGEQGVRSR
jgi:hypothetical protein